MRATVAFGDDRLGFDLDDEAVIGSWQGPDDLPAEAFRAELARALGDPLDFPPLGRAIVPGDQLILAIDADLPASDAVVAAVLDVAREAGVEIESVPIRKSGTPVEEPDRAYLATTTDGHRIYLDRALTDADIVVPIGTLGFDDRLGHRGPWSVVYPGSADAETLAGSAGLPVAASLAESAEVGWLLGVQFELGIVPGAGGGAAAILGGEAERVREAGIAAVDRLWTFRADDRADVVVLGLGLPGQSPDLAALGRALDTGRSLVRRGGKLVVLSELGGMLGPAVTRLTGLDDPRFEGLAAVKTAKGEADYPAALALARALEWADLYLASRFDEDLVESLGIVPLGAPSEAVRLAKQAASVTLVSRADWTRGSTEVD